MKKNKYSAPVVAVQLFSEEYVAMASAVTATEGALRNGILKVNDLDVHDKPIVAVYF